MSFTSPAQNTNDREHSEEGISCSSAPPCDDIGSAPIDLGGTRHLRFMVDGSISASGYFDGLDIRRARQSLKNIREEFVRFAMPNQEHARREHIELTKNPDPHMIPEEHSVGADPVEELAIIATDTSDTSAAVPGENIPGLILNTREEKLFLQLQVFWRKRNWGTKFELYHQYDGSGTLTLHWWNRLLNWVWSTLAKDHMVHLQQFLFRLRTDATSLPNLSYTKSTGLLRSPLQQALIHHYHKVMRAGNTEDLVRIRQRFHLTNLARSHSAYVQEYRTKGIAPQTAR